MKINTKTVLKTIEGQNYVYKDAEQNEQPTTLGVAVANVLSVHASKDPLKSYQLATSFYTNDELDITSEEMVFVKDVLKANAISQQPRYIAHVIGQVIELLEPKAEEKKPESKTK